MNLPALPRLFLFALALAAAAAPVRAGAGFQQMLSMLEERGLVVEAYQNEELGLKILVVTNPETGAQRVRGRYQDGRRFRARRPNPDSPWQVQGDEPGLTVPDLAAMEPLELPGQAPAEGEDLEAAEAVEVDPASLELSPEDGRDEVTIPAAD